MGGLVHGQVGPGNTSSCYMLLYHVPQTAVFITQEITALFDRSIDHNYYPAYYYDYHSMASSKVYF